MGRRQWKNWALETSQARRPWQHVEAQGGPTPPPGCSDQTEIKNSLGKGSCGPSPQGTLSWAEAMSLARLS